MSERFIFGDAVVVQLPDLGPIEGRVIDMYEGRDGFNRTIGDVVIVDITDPEAISAGILGVAVLSRTVKIARH